MWVPQEREEVDPRAAAGVGEGRAQAAQVAPQRREGPGPQPPRLEFKLARASAAERVRSALAQIRSKCRIRACTNRIEEKDEFGALSDESSDSDEDEDWDDLDFLSDLTPEQLAEKLVQFRGDLEKYTTRRKDVRATTNSSLLPSSDDRSVLMRWVMCRR